MEVDPGKRMIFTDMTVLRGGKPVDRIAPAKFVYEKPEGTATTEVAIRSTLSEDVYAIMNSVNPDTKVGTFRVIVRPFVAWIWIGGLLMIFGTAVSMAPSVREVLGEERAPLGMPLARAAVSAATLFVLAVAVAYALMAPALASAQSDGSSSLHAGSVTMRNAEERQLFARLLCECGDCQRLPLSTCACTWAENARARIRASLAQGKSPTAVQEEYRAKYGPQAIAIPADEGLDRLLWAVPVALIALAAVQLVRWGRRWSRKADADSAPSGAAAGGAAAATSAEDPYAAELERELERRDGV
jgi:cytochrome c-type biogenesis protein CcmF